MNKWKSETTDLPSKAQVKQYRVHLWKVLCAQNNLSLELYPIWAEDEKAQARQLWSDTISDYNHRKAELKQALKSLSPEKQTKYFQEIGVNKQNVDDWLT